MQMFLLAYGAEAGNLALIPYGGLYVAGGIAQNSAANSRGKFQKLLLIKVALSYSKVYPHVVLNYK